MRGRPPPRPRRERKEGGHGGLGVGLAVDWCLLTWERRACPRVPEPRAGSAWAAWAPRCLQATRPGLASCFPDSHSFH